MIHFICLVHIRCEDPIGCRSWPGAGAQAALEWLGTGDKNGLVGVALVLPCGNFIGYNWLFLWDYTFHKWCYCIST